MSSLEIPGPVWHEGLSHGTEQDHESHMFYVYAIVNGHKIRSQVRPMSRMEVIHSLLRDFSREEILEAYGVEEKPTPVQQTWWRKWLTP